MHNSPEGEHRSADSTDTSELESSPPPKKKKIPESQMPFVNEYAHPYSVHVIRGHYFAVTWAPAAYLSGEHDFIPLSSRTTTRLDSAPARIVCFPGTKTSTKCQTTTTRANKFPELENKYQSWKDDAQVEPTLEKSDCFHVSLVDKQR